MGKPGRPRKNESDLWANIDNMHKDSETHQVSKMKIPFYNKVIYKIKCSEDFEGNNLYATGETYCNNFLQTKEEVTEEIEKQTFLGVNYKVVRFEPMEIPIKDECPTCHQLGIPKVNKKSNRWDYHSRHGGIFKARSNRPDEYRLIYDHKIGDETHQCVISTLDKVVLNFIKNGKPHAETRANIFPFFLRIFKNA